MADGSPGKSPRLVSELEPDHAEQLVELFSHEWWTKGRDLEGIHRMLEGSTEVVGVIDGDELIAFGRSVSDGIYRASINDIVVAEGRREEGLGSIVVRELLKRPAVAGSSHIDLHCLPGMIGYYERLGFTPSDRGIHRMELKGSAL